jgi:hypothetical protein
MINYNCFSILTKKSFYIFYCIHDVRNVNLEHVPELPFSSEYTLMLFQLTAVPIKYLSVLSVVAS